MTELSSSSIVSSSSSNSPPSCSAGHTTVSVKTTISHCTTSGTVSSVRSGTSSVSSNKEPVYRARTNCEGGVSARAAAPRTNAATTLSVGRVLQSDVRTSLPIDLSKHVIRRPLATSALLDSALSKASYEMSGVDTLATVAAAIDPRQAPAPPPPPPYSSAGPAMANSVDAVDNASPVNNLQVLAKSADGYVMKLVDSRSLKLVNQSGPVYVNVPKDKLMKNQVTGEYQVVRPVVNQTIKQICAQAKSPVPRSPGSPVRSPGPSTMTGLTPPTTSAARSPRASDEPVLSFQVLKAGDKHARRPVSEPTRYITQLTQNIQQQQQLTSSLESGYVMRSLPAQSAQTVRISDHQRQATAIPSGYTSQAVVPNRNKLEYQVLSPEQLQKKMERVKSEYPMHIVRTMAPGPGAQESKSQLRALDVQTMKVVDTLARGHGPRPAEYTATTMASEREAREAPEPVLRSVSADGARPKEKPGYTRVLSVDTALAAQTGPAPPSSDSPCPPGHQRLKRPARSVSSSEHSWPVDDKLIDPELKTLLNDSDKTHWGVVIFNGWLTSRDLRVSPTQLDSVNLASLLTLFYSDLKSELSAEHLNLASLLDMRDAIDQHFRSRGHSCSIVTDIRFGLANQAFDSVIAACDAENKLVSLGIARSRQCAESKSDSGTPAPSGASGPPGSRANPRDLLTRVWVDIKSHLRGFNVDQLRQMKKTDFLVSASEDGRLIVNHVVRNWQDVIKAPTKSGTEYKCIPFMYQNKDNPASCPVVTFMEYSSRLCPSGVEFFQHPLTNYRYAGRIWYSCEKNTRCLIHHRDDTRTPPSSGRSTPSASTPKHRRRSSTGKSSQPTPSPVQSPRPTSTYSDSVHSDQGERARAQEDGSFSPLPDISSILKQPPPLAQIHDNIYHTPVSTPASTDTPVATPTTSTKSKKKKKSSKKAKVAEKPPEPATPTSDVGSEGRVSHLDDILAEVVDKNRRDDVDADRMCLEAMNGEQGGKPRAQAVSGAAMDGGSLSTQQQMAELALRSLEAAVAPSSGVSDAEADRMIGHVVAGLEQADRHQPAGLDMIIDYVVSSNVGEYNELYQYLADDQQAKTTYNKHRRPRNHDLTSNGSSEVMSDIDSVIDQVIQAPGYDELAAPLVAESEWANLGEKRKTPDPEQTLPPKKRKKANNMKMTEFAPPSAPPQYPGQSSPSQRAPSVQRSVSAPVERKYTSMEKIDVLIDDVIAKSLDWSEEMEYDDDTLESDAIDALQDSLPDLASLDQAKLMAGPEFMPGPSTSAFQGYSPFPSPGQRLPPVNTVMGGSPVPTSYPSTPTYPGPASAETFVPPPSYPSMPGQGEGASSSSMVGVPLVPSGPRLSTPLTPPTPLAPPPPYPGPARRAVNVPLSEAVKERLRDKVSNSLSSQHSSHPSHLTPSHVTSSGTHVHMASTSGMAGRAVQSTAAAPPSHVNSSAANHNTVVPSLRSDNVHMDSIAARTDAEGEQLASVCVNSNHLLPAAPAHPTDHGGQTAASTNQTPASQPFANHCTEPTSKSGTPERRFNLRSADRRQTDTREGETPDKTKRVTPDRKARESTPKQGEKMKPVDGKTGDKIAVKGTEKNSVFDKNSSERAVDSPAEGRRGTRSSERRTRQSSESSASDERVTRRAGSTPSREPSPDSTERVTRSGRKAAPTAAKLANDTTSAATSSTSSGAATAATRSRRSTATNNSMAAGAPSANNNSPISTSRNKSAPAPPAPQQNNASPSPEAKKDGRTTRSSTGKDDKSMQLREKSQRFRQLMQRIVSDDTATSSSSS